MAAPARHLKSAARAVGWAFAGLAAVVALFALAGWIGSSIPRTGDWQEPAVRAAYRTAGFRLAARIVNGDWSILWLRRRAI